MMLRIAVCLLATLALSDSKAWPKKPVRARRDIGLNPCDGNVMDVTDTSGELAPPNYPDGYSRGTCVWRIQAGSAQVVKLTFTGILSNCRRGDYVKVEDDHGRVYLYKCGRKNPGIVVTDTSDVTITFNANRRNRNRYGFHLTFEFLDIGFATAPCTFPGVSLNDPSGTVSSTGFDEGGNGAYRNDALCSWSITVADNQNVLLRFDRFDIEDEPNCEWDKVQIFDGIDSSAPMLGEYCGDESPPEIKSTGRSLFVQLTTDGSVVHNGFKMSWETLMSGAPNDGSEPGCTTVNEQTGASGTLTSPYYGSDYPADSDCAHRITVTAGSYIQLTLTDIDIEAGPDCIYDSLNIHDGADATAPLLLDSLCGSATLVIPPSSSNQLYIAFESDSNRQGAGFSLTWAEASSTDPCEGNGLTLTSASGSLSSSGYNGDGYDNDANCKWHIQAADGQQVVLNWQELRVETAYDCEYDAVEVFDGPSTSSKSLGMYCGTMTPQPIKSSGSSLLLHLRTDDSVTDNGFSATYTIASQGTADDGSVAGCGGSVADLTGSSGSFQSPGYDGSTKYGSGAECSWHVTASDSSKNLRLNFRHFDLEEFVGCKADHVRVYVGGHTGGHVSGVRCGQLADFTIYVTDSEALVEFVSDDTMQGTGFQVEWEEVDPVSVHCGQPDPKHQIYAKDQTNQRIIGGAPVNPHSLPWQILLKRDDSWLCGGSVVDENWVLTAAHCTAGGGSFSIVAGAHNIDVNEGTRQERSVSEVHDHPNYSGDTVDHDMSLLRLSSPLTFNEYVQPICIASEDVADGTDCITSGWGVTDSGSTTNILQQVYVGIVNQGICSERYHGGNTITDRMICAGQSQGGIDACNGDSGGPLVCPHPETGVWELQGVTSWGRGCAMAGYPGVWARVVNMKDWVSSVTNNAVTYL